MSSMQSKNSLYFCVIANDCPLYELEYNPLSASQSGTFTAPIAAGSGGGSGREEHKHLNQFIVHAALDLVDELMWQNANTYLKTVDRFNEWLISAYVLPSNVRFMLLHDSKNEDGIKQFFLEVHELYIKTLLNPFYQPTMPITSNVFDLRVKSAAKRYL